MPQYRCSYKCKRQGDESGETVPISILSDKACSNSYSQTGLTECVFMGSEQLPEDPTSKKAGHAVLGAGLGVVVAALTGPPGWVAVGIVAVGAIAGWFS